jgi:hypothetical protein
MDGLAGVSAALIGLGSVAVLSAIARITGKRGLGMLAAGLLTAGGQATGNERMQDAAIGAALGAPFGLYVEAILTAAGYLWKRPEWLPKWFDEGPAQIGAELAVAAGRAFKIVEDDILAAASKAALELTNVGMWELAAAQAGGKLASSIVVGVETAAAKLAHGIGAAVGDEFSKLTHGLFGGSSYTVPTPTDQNTTHTITLSLDGKAISQSVIQHQARVLNAPATGPSGFNPLAGLPSPGMSVNQ